MPHRVRPDSDVPPDRSIPFETVLLLASAMMLLIYPSSFLAGISIGLLLSTMLRGFLGE